VPKVHKYHKTIYNTDNNEQNLMWKYDNGFKI